MQTIEQLNGAIGTPKGDPALIRTLQHFLILAQSGNLGSVVIVGIQADGNLAKGQAVRNLAVEQLALIGALRISASDIEQMLRAQMQQAQPSPILRPMRAAV